MGSTASRKPLGPCSRFGGSGTSGKWSWVRQLTKDPLGPCSRFGGSGTSGRWNQVDSLQKTRSARAAVLGGRGPPGGGVGLNTFKQARSARAAVMGVGDVWEVEQVKFPDRQYQNSLLGQGSRCFCGPGVLGVGSECDHFKLFGLPMQPKDANAYGVCCLSCNF